MTPRNWRQSMKAQRAALKASSRAVRARVAQLPHVQKARRKRRVRRGLTLIAMLLVLVFIRCDCGALVPPEAIGADAGVPVAALAKPVVKATKPPPLQGKVSLARREAFATMPRTAPDWLDAFRMQVSARSPRLAECFQGTERPGALRWVAAVNPDSGAVSDQTFEPVGLALELNRGQRTCLTQVLASPAYKVPAPPADHAFPSRVSLVIEF